MIGDLRLRAKEFFQKNGDGICPLLLGYSGGPDSKALLYLLLECGLRPHVAHVDHGWREESRDEAEEIRKEIESLGLPFYTTRLNPDPREAVARDMRLAFFASLCEEIPFQALLLAHQADDWAETALKRTLEGAHLVYLAGMGEISHWGPVPLWRPLLKVPRTTIIEYIKEKGLKTLEDPTNSNPRYLRARMRTQIIPDLAKAFGKEILDNLVCLAERSQELKEYLDKRTQEAVSKIEKGPWGLLMPPILQEKVEIRHALQRTGVPFTRTILEGVVEAIGSRLPNRKFGQRIIVDRGWFFYLAERLPQSGEMLELKKGLARWGDWDVEIVEGEERPRADLCAIWSGSFTLTPGRPMKEKLPAFLRQLLPLSFSSFPKTEPPPFFVLRFSAHLRDLASQG